MKLKSILALGLASFCVIVGAKQPFGTVILDGGKLEPVSLNMVGATNEHMNFCFANNFEDGSIYINHSEGIHTVTEYAMWRRSLDGGKTWEKTPFQFGGFNSFVNKEGKKCQVESWETKNYTKEHTIRLKVLKDDHSGLESVTTSKIIMPFESNFLLHREVIRTQDDRLLLNAYCRKKGEAKFTSFIIESKDDGKTWQYLSTILEATDKRYTEGPNETTIIQLANGDILAYIRTGGPLTQMRSKDGGKTWGDKVELDKYGVAPAARVLKDGTIVVISGRPATNLYIDFTGEGKNYQCVEIYGGSGCSYASVLEIAPNKIMCIYDESDFGSWKNLSHFSRIMAATYNVIKDDSLKLAKVDHPKAKEYKHFYFPGCMQGMDFRNAYTNYSMLTKAQGESKGTWAEVQKIAERPHPILHMEFKGKAHPFAFSHYYANWSTNAEYSKVKIGFEVRLADLSLKNGQFMVLCKLKKAGGFALVRCAAENIEYRENGVEKKVPYDMRSGFHAFRLEVDANGRTFSLYNDSNNQCLIKNAKLSNASGGNFLQVGDGSSQVFGAVDLSYFGYTVER
ncbi:MAG: exo-alpha-sialidase [Lentisphaeria bacterium]|nr:exo-alpha-sialidase [Lentisphaeria bacterium]